MKIIKVSAPGKLHLLGEHSVVYGKPALLAAINKRVFVTIRESKTRRIEVEKTHKRKIKQLLQILEKEIKRSINIKTIKPYSINIRSQFPIGSGLGSSASISACISAALLEFLGVPWDNKIIYEIAYEGERFFHGNPSGGDLAAVIGGGCLWFRKEFEFLKTFSPLPFKLHKNIKKFLIIDSGKPTESTKEMIGKVADLLLKDPKKIQGFFVLQEELTKNLVIALRDGNENKLMNYIKFGERNLEELGVVGKKAQSLIRQIENIGGVAKISGAGGIVNGSGMLVAYFKDGRKALNLLRSSKLIFEEVVLGGEGLRLEK